jgi:hypothetical protein
VLAGLVLLLAVGGAGWRHQSALVARAARWYLARVGAAEETTGTLARRRAVVLGVHRLLLLAPPPDAVVPELFDLTTLLAGGTASGRIPAAWAAYLYTGYVRGLVRDRPDGSPRRTADEVQSALARDVAFYAVRQRPDAVGVRVSDLLGLGDGYTVEQIEQAARAGVELPLR